MIRKCIKVDTHRTYHIINEAAKKYEGATGLETVKVTAFACHAYAFPEYQGKGTGSK